jgi:uncharacterized membrane protein YhiD involved in acid resistance
MQEFFTQYAKIQNPSFEMVLFTFLLAFICSALIAFVYWLTSPSTLRTGNYIQSLILSSLIATMILQSIGDNVASGLGILGALTIINFRTTFRDPRDIIFMFAALGTGIACGSYVFMIAIVGTSIFCFVGVCLKFTPFHMGSHVIWELRVLIDHPSRIKTMDEVLDRFCRRSTLMDMRTDMTRGAGDLTHEREYHILLYDETSHLELVEALQAIPLTVRRLTKQAVTENAIID